MNAVSSPEASRSNKKRKVDDIEENATDLTLESIMGEIDDLKKSNERIEKMLKILVNETKAEGDGEKEDEEKEEKSVSDDDEDDDEEEEDQESLLKHSWIAAFEELRKFKAKNGHCGVSKTSGRPKLARWVVRQRSENKTGTMSLRDIKIAKLNTLGFDWAPQLNTPAKKSRK